MKSLFKKLNRLAWKTLIAYSIVFLLFSTTATHIGAQVNSQNQAEQVAEADTSKQIAAVVVAEVKKVESLAVSDRASFIAQNTYTDPKLIAALPKADQNQFIAIESLHLASFKRLTAEEKKPLIDSLSDTKKAYLASLSPNEADRFLLRQLGLNVVQQMGEEDKAILISHFSPEMQKYLATLSPEQRDEYLMVFCWGPLCTPSVGGVLDLVKGLIVTFTPIGGLIDIAGGLIPGGGGCSATNIRGCFVGLAKSIATTILKSLFKTVFGTLFHILFYVIFWLITIMVLPFGLDLNPLVDTLGPLKAIKDFVSDLTPWAYTAGTEQASRFNLFTIVDAGIGGVYSSIPSENPAQYLAYTVQNNILGIKTASAQGVGTQSFTGPIQQIWQKSQQLALILMVLVLIAMGFMIMFRKRLSPQVSVTVLNSIPRVGLALILITFSFAISGLFIDLAYVGVNIIRNFYGLSDFFQFFNNNAGGELIWIPIFTFLSGGTIFDWAKLLSLAPFSAAGGTIGLAGAFAILLAIVLIEMLMRLTLFGVSIYLFWILLKNFTLMIVYTILSPFFFMMGAVPGFESVTINWAKRMLANALLFPLVVFFLYLALGFILGDNFVFQVYRYFGGGGGGGTPVNIQAPPPLGTNLLNISYLAGLGIMFFATKLPTFLEKVMKLESFDIRGGIGGGILIAPITAPLGLAASMGKGNPIAGASQMLGYGRNVGKFANTKGYGERPPATNWAVMGASGTYQQAAPPAPGRIAAIARGVGRVLPKFITEGGKPSAPTSPDNPHNIKSRPITRINRPQAQKEADVDAQADDTVGGTDEDLQTNT